jgi:acetyl-CoA acetyltransferase
MAQAALRGRAAVVGIGETRYYKRGQSPDAEFKLALRAIVAACADAGLHPRDIDGFTSFSNDRCDPSRLAAALGCRELRFASMQWGGGGGGGSAAVGTAAAAIATGMAECVVVFRALAQGEFGRFGQGTQGATVGGEAAHTVPYGVMSPAQQFAMKVQR